MKAVKPLGAGMRTWRAAPREHEERALFFQLFRDFLEVVAAGSGPVDGGAWRAYKEVRRPIKPGRRLAAKIQLFCGLRSLDMGVAIDNNPRSAATPFLEVFFRSSARIRAESSSASRCQGLTLCFQYKNVGECPEWQRGRTVNPLAFAFVGSSPTSPTTFARSRRGARHGESDRDSRV